ncbi:MAG: type IV toxin-antitoxin system AbiEi family antitoxin domain-containing protein [Solirubrobacteraceae bacterium]
MNALAQRQQGYVSRRQLLKLGLGRGAITARLRCGRLTVEHRGVYAVGPRRAEPRARAAAAVLACGSRAVLSHESAASLWGMLRRWSFPLEVTVAGNRAQPGITIHRSRTLRRADITREYGIPVTSPARTLLDIAPRLTDERLTRIVNDALRTRLLGLDALSQLLARSAHHRGVGRLRPFVQVPNGPTASAFEDRFLAFVRAHGLPEPQMNARVLGREVDALFMPQRVIVELDSWEFHHDRTAFIDDRERDASALEADFLTIRLTWERLDERPDEEAARLRRILRMRSGT